MYPLKHRDPCCQKLNLSRWNTRSRMNCRWKSTECKSPITIRQDKSFLDLNLKNSMSFLQKGFVRGRPTSTLTVNSNLQQKNIFATGLRIIKQIKTSRKSLLASI